MAWILTYHKPEEHPRITDSERAMILATRAGADEKPAGTRAPMLQILGYRQTWGCILSKAILDPYWYLVADWFALFLVSRGFKLEDTLVGFWVPFVCRTWAISWAAGFRLVHSSRLDRGRGAAGDLSDLRPDDAAHDSGGLHDAALAIALSWEEPVSRYERYAQMEAGFQDVTRNHLIFDLHI